MVSRSLTTLRNHESFLYRRERIDMGVRDAVDTRSSVGINLIRSDRRESTRPLPEGLHASNVSDDGAHDGN